MDVKTFLLKLEKVCTEQMNCRGNSQLCRTDNAIQFFIKVFIQFKKKLYSSYCNHNICRKYFI